VDLSTFDRVIGCFGLSSPPAVQNITLLVRILPPPRAWLDTKPKHENPQCFDDSRDAKNDSIWGARREIQRRRRHAPSCMGATELQSNWPEMRKTLGKPGFCSGEDRNRTPTNSLGKSHFDTTRDAKYDARRFQCLRRLGTPSIATILQPAANLIYSVTSTTHENHLASDFFGNSY
jgi:hypothetical protein